MKSLFLTASTCADWLNESSTQSGGDSYLGEHLPMRVKYRGRYG